MNRIFLLCLVLLTCTSVRAQNFSKEKTEFRAQVLAKIKARGTESAYKIAFDFQNAWDGKFTNQQQDQIHSIALEMQQKGFPFYPTFYHYFTYLAYSVSQEGINTDQLNEVLDINSQVIKTLTKKEYQEFVFGLNIFFARRYLSYDKNLAVQAVEGSYEFKQLDEVPSEIETSEEEISQDTASFISEEEIPEIIEDDGGWDTSNDPWDTSNDPWSNSNDSWSSDDSWNTDDSWGNDDGGWDTGDSWRDDSWGAEEKEPTIEQPTAPTFDPIYTDYLATQQSKHAAPQIDGPVLEIINTRIVMATPYDSIRIKNVKATFLLKNRALVGTQGSIEWPARQSRFSGANIQLKDFYIKKDRANFWTPFASLEYKSLTGVDAVEGIFDFEARSNQKRSSRYPVFTSNKGGLTIDLGDERLRYRGGIQLQGNQLFGKSVSREVGTLRVLDGKGRSAVIKSKEFFLGESLVSMEKGSITILHGVDSITHENVRAKYDKSTNKLMVLRNESATPFVSSYFEVDMGVDQISWNMENGELGLEVVNARGLNPATFRSSQFFDINRYRKLSRFLDFHPVNASVYYARKYGVEKMYTGELALEYKINE
ncbi:MAG: hypothetical protein AAF789_00600, partial [Bacteroidota bacterium]